jgi:hypothetical protein
MINSLKAPNDRPWEKLGRILAPNKNIPWLATFTGPACALPLYGGPLCDVYVAGRDDKNRSRIGRIRINLDDPGGAPRSCLKPSCLWGAGVL